MCGIDVRSPGATVNDMPRFRNRHIRSGGGMCRDVDIDGRAWGLQDDAVWRTRAGRQSKATLSRRSSEVAIFSLGEIVQENGYTVEKNFQSFTFPNAKTTSPIPFALNIDSPKDCPKELQLSVTGSDHVGFHHEYPLNGGRRVNLEKFERIRVYPPTF